MISAVPDVMRGRPKATGVLAVLPIVAGLTLVVAREAVAAHTFNCSSQTPCGTGFPRDTDGFVREGRAGLNSKPHRPGAWLTLGRTYWYGYSSGVPGASQVVDDSIRYDWPATAYTNTPRWKVYGHEHAHARGWAHGEAPDSQNDAHSPDVDKS